MKAIFTPCKLQGKINAPPSKSMAHRLLICAALSDRETEIGCDRLNEDIEATVRCLAALGAEISLSDGIFTVKPSNSSIVFVFCAIDRLIVFSAVPSAPDVPLSIPP